MSSQNAFIRCTYSSDVKVVDGGTFQPLSEEVFLDTWFGLEDGEGNGPLCYWSSLWLPGDDEAAREACILYHLVT